MSRLCLCILLFVPFGINAQVKTAKGYNTLGIAITGSRYFNRQNIENSNPENPIRPNNTNGYAVGIVYNRVTKHNIILEAALSYGFQKHDVDIIHNLENFDPEAMNNLVGLAYKRNVTIKINYISPRIMVGYKYNLNNTWAIIGKAGVSRALYLNGVRSDSNQASVVYKLDNGNDYRVAKFNAETYYFGESAYRSSNKLRIWDDPLDSWEFYVGAERKIQSFWIRKAFAGLSFTRTIGKNLSPNLIEYYITKWNQPVQSADFYVIKNLSLGLVVGITF